MEGFHDTMEAPPWNRESDEKELVDGNLSNAKRKVVSSLGLFCVMRKRIRSDDAEKFLLDEDVDECWSSDLELSECSEFDIISQHVFQDFDLMGESTGFKSLSEGTLLSKFSSQTQNSILLVSPDQVDEDNCVIRSKKDPQVQCSSDSDKSSKIEVRDVVNIMQPSLEQMSSDDELRPRNKDDYPIPICSVPPAQESSILLENCSLHQNVKCINGNNVHGDDIGIEISPIPLQGPSRSLSVCGSLAAGRNLPLVEERSGACSSLDEKLYVNVGSSEKKDARLAQTPLSLYQEEVDGEDEICFSDIDAMIRRLNLLPEDSDTCLNMSKHPRHTLLGLEHCTRTSMRRALMFQGAIAVLHCRDSKHYIRKHEVIIGRSSHGLKVDIDLGKDGYGSKISRRQALVKLENTGSFSLKNLGKRHILVNGEKLNTGQIGTLESCSSVNFKGIVFEFKINKEAVRQFLKNNTRSNSADDAKFKWCE